MAPRRIRVFTTYVWENADGTHQLARISAEVVDLETEWGIEGFTTDRPIPMPRHQHGVDDALIEAAQGLWRLADEIDQGAAP